MRIPQIEELTASGGNQTVDSLIEFLEPFRGKGLVMDKDGINQDVKTLKATILDKVYLEFSV
jgi:hypothetical protein